MRKSTIDDIAQQLGVSKTLVSFVLNGKSKQHRINEDVAAKVLETARILNYQPNHFARGLRTGKTKTLGVIVSDISNPLFAKLCRYIEDSASENYHNIIIASSDENPLKLKNAIDVFLNKKVDGLIIVPTEGSETILNDFKNKNLPMVLVDRFLPSVATSYVVSENFSSVYKIISTLLAKGIHKIGYVGLSIKLQNYKERLEGFTNAFRDAKVTLSNEFIESISYNGLKQDLKPAIERLINAGAEAVFFANNTIALESLICLKKMAVPVSFPIYCFDNDPAFCLSEFKITVIKQQFDIIGKKAVEILLQMIEKSNEYEERVHVETLEFEV